MLVQIFEVLSTHFWYRLGKEHINYKAVKKALLRLLLEGAPGVRQTASGTCLRSLNLPALGVYSACSDQRGPGPSEAKPRMGDAASLHVV